MPLDQIEYNIQKRDNTDAANHEAKVVQEVGLRDKLVAEPEIRDFDFQLDSSEMGCAGLTFDGREPACCHAAQPPQEPPAGLYMKTGKRVEHQEEGCNEPRVGPVPRRHDIRPEVGQSDARQLGRYAKNELTIARRRKKAGRIRQLGVPETAADRFDPGRRARR
jgi:hypothetical protein